MQYNQWSTFNTTILELSETLFHTSVSVIVVVLLHFFTIVRVHLYLGKLKTFWIMIETVQHSNTFLSYVRPNRTTKKFVIWSYGWKVTRVFKYIFQYTKYVLKNPFNFWSELPGGMKLVTSPSVGLGEQSLWKCGQLSASQKTCMPRIDLTNDGT